MREIDPLRLFDITTNDAFGTEQRSTAVRLRLVRSAAFESQVGDAA
jgi:hypothetical protein